MQMIISYNAPKNFKEGFKDFIKVDELYGTIEIYTAMVDREPVRALSDLLSGDTNGGVHWDNVRLEEGTKCISIDVINKMLSFFESPSINELCACLEDIR